MSAPLPLQQRFADSMGQLLGPDFPSDIGLAVSGGGDSMAMLTLAHNWARDRGVRLWVVTVDHGLRAESAAEAAMVAAECAALGWPHATLRWHWDGQGNKMDAARRGRLEMIDRWRGTLRHVLMAHTRDDVAETFVMRLARGSGVEGLSAMAARRMVRHDGLRLLAKPEFDGTLPQQCETFKGGPGRIGSFQIIRPCLDMERGELRHYLRTLKGHWLEDPSNDDPAYDRARIRQALPQLAALGLDLATLAATARRMARAREALNARARDVAERLVTEERLNGLRSGALLIDRDGLSGVEADTRLRLFAAALQWVASAEYRPRAQPLEALVDRLISGGAGTLHGCVLHAAGAQIRVDREFAALRGQQMTAGDGARWDRRWRVTGPVPQGATLRALGPDGLKQAGGRPDGAPPAQALHVLPAVFAGETLLSCPHLGFGPPGLSWRLGADTSFAASFVLH